MDKIILELCFKLWPTFKVIIAIIYVTAVVWDMINYSIRLKISKDGGRPLL